MVDAWEIVNAQTEAAAYESVVGEVYPGAENINEDLEWECVMITLQPGQRMDLGRY
jgi:hypothetical protein